MSYFSWLSIALLVLTVIFYVVFSIFMYYYHEKKTTVVVVPMIYTFEFFLTGFLVISIISIALEFFPEVLILFAG